MEEDDPRFSMSPATSAPTSAVDSTDPRLSLSLTEQRSSSATDRGDGSLMRNHSMLSQLEDGCARPPSP